MSKRNIVFSVLTVIWMIVIFVYSSKAAEESNANSDAVEKIIGQVAVTDFSEKTEKEVQNLILDWRIPIRKVAHACEYALLCVLMFWALPETIKMKYRLIISIGGSLLYGISDEIHQSFVPGRTALVSDVLIDLAGACAGGIVVAMIAMIVSRRKKDRI